MQVKDIMTPEVELIDPESTIRDAAKTMREENIGALPVGENDRLIGMVTDRDIVTRAVADDCDPSDTSVREIMSSKVCYCFEDNDLDAAARLMADHQVRRLPVLNRQKRLVGLVTLADLTLYQLDVAKMALQGISQPSVESRHMSGRAM